MEFSCLMMCFRLVFTRYSIQIPIMAGIIYPQPGYLNRIPFNVCYFRNCSKIHEYSITTWDYLKCLRFHCPCVEQKHLINGIRTIQVYTYIHTVCIKYVYVQNLFPHTNFSYQGKMAEKNKMAAIGIGNI